jgi:Flp pilus assembly protein CpaB
MLATPNAVRPAALPSLVGRRLRVPLLKGDLLLASALAPNVPAPPAAVEGLSKHRRGVTLSVSGAEHVHAGSHLDLVAVLPDPRTGETVSATLLQSVSVIAVGELTSSTDGLGLRRVTLELTPEEGESALLTSHAGALRVSLRNPDAFDVLEERRTFRTATLFDDALQAELDARQRQVLSEEAALAPGGSTDVGARIHPKLRAFTGVFNGAEEVRQGDHIDVVSTMKDPKMGWVTITPVQRAAVLAVGPPGTAPGPTQRFPLRQVTVEVLPEQAQLLALAAHTGQLEVLLRNPNDIDVLEVRVPTTCDRALSAEHQKLLQQKRMVVGCILSWGSGTAADAGR